MNKGLEDIVVAQTKLSRVDGDNGTLIFCGYDIRELARFATFEDAAYLLWHNELPTRAQLTALKQQLADARGLPDVVLRVLRDLPRDTAPMDALRTGVSALGAGSQLARPNLAQAIALTAQVPLIVAAFDRMRRGREPLAPRADLDHAANYLYLLSGTAPTSTQNRALNTYLVLLADHGLNASTFAARVVASTLSDLHSSIVAAIGALKGPLHGGAPSRVLDMLDAIGAPANAETWIRAALARKERLMGFGHRMYKTADPRAEILRELACATCAPEFFARAQMVEETGLRILRAQKPGERLYTNVEFYSAAVLNAVGLPRDLFTATFAVSRMAGWTAHVLEQVADNRIIRPDAEYVGRAPSSVISLDNQ
ncbi:MAG: citrate synthase [Chloroflexi bacterium]|nr:citrate synthase [Chloroflexota bacterium]